MRRLQGFEVCVHFWVSIHASVKDATQKYIQLAPWLTVSIHASVKDATDNISATDMLTIVSIHASVKDATWC